ncbi:hypothetical protein [Paraburkholderia bannensis]|uniref:hypothetical protein n=1 Tax=Paraburkholderia bannensis TaxID=765414 RepID=UPI002AC33BEC|nr:hypothetical protein [Paraburkholderia bannensis]
MMTNLVWNFSHNYGVLIIAGITFCIVQALSYLFRRYAAVHERRASVIHVPVGAGTDVIVREEFDRTVKALVAVMRKRETARSKLQAQFKGRTGYAVHHGVQSAAYVGSLRHSRKTRPG